MAPGRTIPSRNGLRQLLVCTLLLAGLLAGVFLPRRAAAQDVDDRIESLVDSASSDYDNLEIPSSIEKLERAIELGEEQNASDSVVARAYVMLGVVRYGKTRDKDKALEAFERAAKRDPEASIPNVYETPTLSELMKQAKESVGTGAGTGAEREVDEFDHEPISSAQAGEPLLVEAFVPTDLAAETVEFVFKRYNQDEWSRVELEATNATRYAEEVPGYRIYSPQITYYLVVRNSAGDVVARSASESEPHTFTVLGNAGFDPEEAKEEYLARQEEDEEEREGRDEDETEQVDEDEDADEKADEKADDTDELDRPSDDRNVGYVDVGAGTGLGLLTGGTLKPTANSDRPIQPGVTSAFAHLRIGGGYVLPNGAQLGLYFRFQFLPTQDFDQIRNDPQSPNYRGFADGPCLGSELPGDCLLGAKYRWFFSEPTPVQWFSSIGAGFGRVRHWLRLRERVADDRNGFCERENKTIRQNDQGEDFCFRADTARPGWIHLGVGGGLTYELTQTVSLLGEAYLQFFFPDTGFNLDVNIGPQFRF